MQHPLIRVRRLSYPLHLQALKRPNGWDVSQGTWGWRVGSGYKTAKLIKHPPPPHCAQPLGSGPSTLHVPSRQQLYPEPSGPLKRKGENLSVFLSHSISHKAIISIFPFLCKSGHTQLAWTNPEAVRPSSATQPTPGLSASRPHPLLEL